MLAVDDEDEEENEMDKRTAGRKAETGKSFPVPELHPIFAITNSPSHHTPSIKRLIVEQRPALFISSSFDIAVRETQFRDIQRHQRFCCSFILLFFHQPIFHKTFLFEDEYLPSYFRMLSIMKFNRERTTDMVG